MGFFKRELNKAIKRSVNNALKPKQQKQSRQRQIPQAIPAVVQMRPWDCPQQAKTIELDGNYENVLYTYNTEPLKGVRKGQTIAVDIYRGDAVLYSKHSDDSADSEEWGGAVVIAMIGNYGTGRITSHLTRVKQKTLPIWQFVISGFSRMRKSN